MEAGEGMTLQLAATAENIARVRRDVAAHARHCGASTAAIGDLKIIVSEACANVVRYAYEEGESERPLEVELVPGEQELRLVVRDRGSGVRPRLGGDDELPSLCLGLPVIGALSSGFRLSSRRGQGTELTITLPCGEAA
jgi:anti-sigma regulatory factor (Ser/Thr protein kinase)